MKNIVKTFLIVIAVTVALFSIIGVLAYLAYYFLSGNSKLAKALSKRISGLTEDNEELLEEEDYLGDSLEESNSYPEIEEEVSENVIVPDPNIETEIVLVEEPVVKQVKKPTVVKVTSPKKIQKNKFGLNPRQNDLLKFIKNNESATMYDISKVFSKVTQRTLRRDLEKLEETGLVKQDGKTRNSIYKLV